MDDSLLLVIYVAAMMFAVTGLARVYLYRRMRTEWRLTSRTVRPARLRRVNLQLRAATVMMVLSVAAATVVAVAFGFNEHVLVWPALAGLVLYGFVGRTKLRA